MRQSPNNEVIQSNKQVIRQSFRLPVAYCKDVLLKITDQSYEIVNIGSRGIAFYPADKTNKFKVDTSLHPIVLQLQNDTIKVQGQIVHVSTSGSKKICGMKFVDMQKESEESLVAYIHNTTASIFDG